MSLANLALWLLGIALVAVGYARFRAPWARYRGLRDQQANIDRYEAWRGGLRTHDDGPTGASVAIELARRQAQQAGVLIAAGIAVFALGFFVR